MPKHRTNRKACTTARIEAGLSQREAARRISEDAGIKVSGAHISAIESGKWGASAGLLKALATLYGVEMSSLYDFDVEAVA